jgi:hypothetical protein
MKLKKICLLFLAFFIYYILSPIILIEHYQINELSISAIRELVNINHANPFTNDAANIYKFIGSRVLLYKKIHNENYKYYEFFSILFLIFFFFISCHYLKNIKLSYPKFIIKDQKIIFTFIITICIFFLLKDLLLLINYHYSTKIILREELYELINNRKTYLNVLIFASVINFKLNKKLSYLSYSLILLYDGLSLSRYSFFILIILHFFVNIDFNRRNLIKWFYFFLIILSIIFYRIILQNRNLLTFFLDSWDVRLGSEITFENLKNITHQTFFIENIKFILRDFFFIDYPNINFLQKRDFPSFAARGIDTIICYFLVFIIYIISLFFLIKNFKISIEFINCSNIFLLISLFRGNFVHNLNFVIKLYLLVFFIQWLIKILRRLKLKVV